MYKIAVLGISLVVCDVIPAAILLIAVIGMLVYCKLL